MKTKHVPEEDYTEMLKGRKALQKILKHKYSDQHSLEYNRLDFEKPNEENNNREENGEDNEAEPEKFIYYKGIFLTFSRQEELH